MAVTGYFRDLTVGDVFQYRINDGSSVDVRVVDTGEGRDALGRPFDSIIGERLDTGQVGHILYGYHGMY